MENVKEKFVEHLCELDDLEFTCRESDESNVAPEMTDEQKVHNAIAHVDPNLVLRNLAFWLDIATAKGRFIDMMQQQQAQENAVSTSDNDKE